MNREPIHKNLSTSFVDLEALVKHLAGLQFVGIIHVELSICEADIILTARNKIYVREYQHGSGTDRYGREALDRIFRIAREPYGRIHVYRTVRQDHSAGRSGVFIDEAIAKKARKSLTTNCDTPAYHLVARTAVRSEPDYPSVIAELLRTVDSSLRNARLNFPEAFRNTCSNLSPIYPFLHPKFGAVRFTDENVKVDVRVDAEQFTAALVDVLSTIISRVSELAARTDATDGVQKGLLEFAKRRHAELDRLGLSRLPERLIDQI